MFPFVAVVDSPVFSIAFVAEVFAPSSAEAGFLASGIVAGGSPIDKTFVLGTLAAGVSPPIESVLTTGGPEDVAGLAAGAWVKVVGGAVVSPPVGLLAITGGLCGWNCCCCG